MAQCKGNDGDELLPPATLKSQAADVHTGPVAQDKGIHGGLGVKLLPLPTPMSQAADGNTGPVAQDKGIDGG